jgi:hypothetical protein
VLSHPAVDTTVYLIRFEPIPANSGINSAPLIPFPENIPPEGIPVRGMDPSLIQYSSFKPEK